MNALQVAAACGATVAATLAVLSGLSRLRFGRMPGAFRCRLGPPSQRRSHRVAWRARCTYAVWLNDVFVFQSGLLRLSVTPVALELAREAAVESLDPYEVRGLGRHAVALRLTGVDGSPLVVATSARNRTALVGPFLAASVPGLPRAPHGNGA